MIISQVRKHYRGFKISPKLVIKLTFFIVFIFSISFLYNHLKYSNYFPIKEVKVTGLQHVDQKKFQNLLLPFVNSGFFAVDVSLIKDKIRQFNWIEESQVTRVWPNQVVIKVVEKKPIARWNNSSLLTTRGEIFKPEDSYIKKDLPLFVGPTGEQMQMLEYYNSMSALLSPLKFTIKKLELTQAYSWNITFGNGLKINTGYDDALTRINRFVKVFPKIVGSRVKDVEYIDLRYQDGIAVHWKGKA